MNEMDKPENDGTEPFYNVTEEQIGTIVGSVIEDLQLDPDLSNDLYPLLVNWLEKHDVEIIPMGSSS